MQIDDIDSSDTYNRHIDINKRRRNFPVDGQYRVVSIKKVLEMNPDLELERVQIGRFYRTSLMLMIKIPAFVISLFR